jgi:TolB-like protein/tetratricopeptide (TPR) repeat protein
MVDDATLPPSGDPPAPRFASGAYAVEGVLGAGGMAVVYRARDLRHARSVAIKVLRAEVAQGIGTERFLREIAVTAGFTHPHILPLLDSGETTDGDGRPMPYYVMPLIAGESLADRLRAERQLAVAEAVRLTAEILQALRYAHERGIVHRDIKPANVLLSDGHAVVADFGVARTLQPGGLGPPGAGMTVSGMALGTPAYMSPEQAMGTAAVDARTDLYAVGCVLYEMLGGVSPFDAPTPQAFFQRKFSGAVEPLSRLRPGVPSALDALLARAMAPEPSDRFDSAGEFLEALGRLPRQGDEGSAAVPVVAPEGTAEATSVPAGPPLSAGSAAASLAGPSPVPAPVFAPRRWRVIGAVAGVVVLAVGVWGGGRGARAGGDAPPSTTALEPTRIAVLPPEIVGLDTLVATTLHGDVIDELARYPALTVISRNGVMGFSAAARVDSVARTLGAGSLIAWRARGDGDSVWVTARLIDGATAEQVASHAVAGRRQAVLAVRSALVDSVTMFLRRQLGVRMQATEASRASSAEAWRLVAQADALEQPQVTRSLSDELTALALRDSLLLRAQRLDSGWDRPYERRVALRIARGSIEALTSQAVATKTRREAISLADAALARLRDSTRVLVQRGYARLELWLAATDVAPDSLRVVAEADLRAAVTRRPDLAMGWYWLSQLYEANGDFAAARNAVVQARRADAYLEQDDMLLARLMLAQLALGQVELAERSCQQGLALHPDNPTFWDCELTLLAWNARRPEQVERAWVALRDAERRDPSGLTTPYAGQRRLMVAAVAAHAGRAERARALVDSIRALPTDAEVAPVLDLNEAYVRVALGEPHRAVILLGRYLRRYPAYRGWVRRHPWFAPLASDPAFLGLTSPSEAGRRQPHG